VKISSLASAGSLKLSGTAVNLGAFITVVDINAVLQAGKNDSKLDRDLAGGKIYAPVVIAQGSLNDFVSKNPNNSGDLTSPTSGTTNPTSRRSRVCEFLASRFGHFEIGGIC
jgi:hypothetical protein